MDSVPVSLSIPSRLLATFGLCRQERHELGRPDPVSGALSAPHPTARRGLTPKGPCPPARPVWASLPAPPLLTSSYRLGVPAQLPTPQQALAGAPQDHQARHPRALTGKRGAGSPRCRPSAPEAGAGLCVRQWPETLHPSGRPRPGPAAELSNGSGKPAGHPGHGDQPPPRHPQQRWDHPTPECPPPSHRLTQETTRPLKQGSLALSAEISSFTTLWADAA